MTSPERLKKIQELAARVRAAERALVEVDLARGNRGLSSRLQQLRARELVWQNMTETEKENWRKFEQEMDKDLEEYNTGANSGDWTK